jgi:hypothetical protein
MSDWDNTQARSEGWLLVDEDNVIVALNGCFGLDMNPSSDYRPSDARAIAFIQQKAKEGSAYHIEALARTQLL